MLALCTGCQKNEVIGEYCIRFEERHYDVKDSGTIIPGHGGLLDRFDSALIAIPIGIIYLVALDAMCV